MAEFNLFGNGTKDDIRVAYISTERGLVDDVTVCEANDYAKLNPGTQFIFRTREFTKYMNINGVNKLTPDDLSPKKDCDGINMTKECGPPQAFFAGGGGVGIKGNPVIGQDGAVLAVDLVSGGFGYQVPPNVQVKDNCGIGAGGNFVAELGEITERFEYYDTEDDFEDYEICEGASDTGVFGDRYGVNGENLGPWEPRMYANFDKDPIAIEIKKYQDIISKGTNPFWTTRTEAPLQVTGNRGTSRKVFNVDHSAWSGFMNKYAISPKPKSNASGTDFAGIPFSFVWEEDFPQDGEYVFRGAGDNKAKLFLDGVFISNLDGFNGALNPLKKTLKSGIHQIRIDLFNIPIKEKVIIDRPVAQSGTQTIIYKNLHGVNNPINVSDDRKIIRLRDGHGDDTNGQFTIKSGDLRFSSDGKSLVGPGSATIELWWKDKSQAGRSVDSITVAGKTWTRSGTRGSQSQVVTIDPPPVVNTKKSTSSQDDDTHKVFNTVDFIDKANRPLWRTNVYGRGGFLNQYGVCPFDTAITLEDNPYSGTHTIIWNNVHFPIDGNYDIGVQVDDNVKLIIEGNGKKEIINKKGFAGDTDTSTGKSTYIRRFAKGNYTITAEVEQIPGGKFGFDSVKGINPMALAVNIESLSVEKEVISAKSWNENPMGVALSIDAPDPPIPQEEIPKAPGRCPRNPMWSTRYPGAKEKWHPVRVDGWSSFLNRFAMSPVPPRSEKNTDAGGVMYTNSWQQDIPYNGWYKIRAEVDDIGRIYINGEKKLDLSRRNDKIRGEEKFFLSKGSTEIKVEVENYETGTFKKIDKQIFNTSDWGVNQKEKGGIKYKGPELATYHSGELGQALTPKWDFTGDKILDEQEYRENFMGKEWTSTWENVEFPEDGQYQIQCLVDDTLSVKIDGSEVAKAVINEQQATGPNFDKAEYLKYGGTNVKTLTFNATKGRRTITATYTNIPGNETSTFSTNPVYFSFKITKKMSVRGTDANSWEENPIGISAVLIPPPCPKKISGKGTISRVIVDDPGNGFPKPAGDGYPVGLGLSAVNIKDAGINYNCAKDKVVITPSNGAKLSLSGCDNFGRISKIDVDETGFFTTWPKITIESDTGVNFEATPIFEVIRDPIVVDQDKLVQVTDLVGIKQNGYYQGRPYYGAVFYKDNIRYAGWYETPGQLVQIYDTMQESIDAEVTTPPSAILRQGSDASSNDSKLNLPGTPDNLI